MEPLCVISSWIIKRVYTILISNTISGSSSLDNYFYHFLILTLISHLKDLFNSLLYYYIYIICNLYSWPPCGLTLVLPGYLLLWHSCTWDKTSTLWSCQVFGVVVEEVSYCINYIFYFSFHFYCFSNFCFFLFLFLSFFFSALAWEFGHAH